MGFGQGTDDNGDTYYYSRETGNSLWELPPGGILVADDTLSDWSGARGSLVMISHVISSVPEATNEEEEEEEEDDEDEVPEEERHVSSVRREGTDPGMVAHATAMAWLGWGQAHQHQQHSAPQEEEGASDGDGDEGDEDETAGAGASTRPEDRRLSPSHRWPSSAR